LLNSSLFKKGLETILKGIEADLSAETANTPERFARACVELFSGYGKKPKLRKFKIGSKSVVRFSCLSHTMCEHHFLSILLHVRVAYKPNLFVIGVSKIPRLVNYYASRLQLQERLTRQISEHLYKYINPQWIRVQIHGFHCCTFARGAKTQGIMVTDVTLPEVVTSPDYLSTTLTYFAKPSVLEALVGGESIAIWNTNKIRS